MNEIVNIKNLSIKDQKNNTLVSRVSLSIKKGEIFGLVGESGSGKTLTAKSMINLLPENLKCSAEKIIAFEHNIDDISDKDIRTLIGKNVGFIPQNTVFYLHPIIKIKNQIADSFVYHMKKSKKEGLEKAEVLLNKVGFNNPKSILNYYPYQLSGGMRQRVNIAMAIMNDPQLIIADEPTTALDSTIQRQVVDLFKSINEDMGISILLISHDLGLIKHYSDSVAVMYAGQIVESGDGMDVLGNPRHPYTELMTELIPSLKMKKDEPLPEIPGFVQENGREKSCCIFMDRCPKAMDSCGDRAEEHVIGNNHYFKCNLF